MLHINPRQLVIPTPSANDALGLRFLPSAVLQNWERHLKCLASANEDASTTEELNSSFQLDDFDQDDRRLQLGENATPASLASLVGQDIPLNKKQKFVVIKVLAEALAWVGHPYDSSRRKQLLLCITGEGGTGKSQILRAVVAAMDLLGRKDEIMMMASTGAAAEIIGGNTYHTCLGISINHLQKGVMGSHI